MTQSHEFTININSRPRKVEGEYITFEEVLKLGGVDTIIANLSQRKARKKC